MGLANGVYAHRRIKGNLDSNGVQISSTEAIVTPATDILFSVPGDSGSLILTVAGNIMVGMIFAGTRPQVYLAVHIGGLFEEEPRGGDRVEVDLQVRLELEGLSGGTLRGLDRGRTRRGRGEESGRVP